MERISKGNVFGYTSVLVLDEFIYKILLKLIEVDYKENPISVLRREKFSVVKKYSTYIGGFLKQILTTENLEVLPVTREDLVLSLTIINETGLLPRDAIHIAVMYRNNINAIASTDHDFDVVEDITRYSPIPPKSKESEER